MKGGERLTVAIAGAGVHGCALAVRLLSRWPALRSGLRLIDPTGTCLAEWTRRTAGQGMDTMRSPGAHHLDVAPESLVAFARAHGRENELRTPYARPSLSLFMDHARAVVAAFRLEEVVVPARVEAVEPLGTGYRLDCSDGVTRRARWLMLAPGLGGHERLPEWAHPLVRQGSEIVTHVEDVDIRREALAGLQVLVVGGGLSAATLADAAARRGARVILVSRHRLEARLFDVDPGWVGPKYLRFFHAETDPEARWRMIQQARGRATVTPELLEQLHRHAAGRLEIREEDDVEEARPVDDGRALVIRLRTEPHRERWVDRAWCATGTAPRLDRLGWLGSLRRSPQCAGLPLVAPTLEVRPGCFVTGWLAALGVGPAARNISGGRQAASSIAEVLAARIGARDRVPGAA